MMTEKTKQPETLPEKVKAEYFEKIRDKWLEQSDQATFAREISFTLQLVNKNKRLRECTRQSVLESVLNIIQIGLTLNPALKLAYLIPRWDNHQKALVCNLEASYQGLVKLITDTGSCKKIYAHPVHTGDTFSVSLGTSVEVQHIPQFKSKTVEKVYAIGVLKDGTTQVEVMTDEQINEIRDKSESYKAFKDPKKKVFSAIWETNYTEMARKTVIRRLCKYLPKTEQWDQVAKAIELDETDYTASWAQLSYLENLIGWSTIPVERQDALYQELNTMTASRAAELITELKEKQVPGMDHTSPQAGDVNEKVKDKVEDPDA